jgi:putative ABC transport system permease protein
MAVTIVGVVADNRAARGNVLLAEDGPELYRPYLQAHSAFPIFLVRAASTPAPLLRPVRETLIRLVPDRPVFASLPSEAIARQLRGARVTAAQVFGFAVAGLALALIGIYGVLAYELGQRRREIGIRAALGAPRRRITWLMILDAARLAAIGIVLGVPAAVFAMRLFADAVYPTSPTDPTVFAAVALVTLLVSMLAAYLPAWRAARVDPVLVLRDS